jgi:ATP-dependent DNA ligase
MKRVTLYQKTKISSKIQQWDVWVVECGDSGFPEVYVEYGHTDGKKQTTFDVIKDGVNEGKANATTPLQQAYLVMERKITKQRELGYTDTTEATEKDLSIDWSKPFPKELCFFKPKSSIDDKKLAALEKAGRAVYTVKRDGLMTVVRSCDAGVEIYSRRMDNITDRFEHLTEAFKSLPKRTILLGEAIVDVKGRDDFKACTSICRSESHADIHKKQEQYGKIKYYAFDIAFHQGKDLLTTTTFKKRREILLDLVNRLGSEYVVASQVIPGNHSDAMKVVTNQRLEGLVVWDSDGMMESGRAYTFTGKPDRPGVVWKSKPIKESDFIVRFDPDNGIGDYGKGKLKGLLGKVFIYQLLDGQEVFLGKCGGGLSEEQRKIYADPLLFPRAWRIKYDFAQPGTGKLRFPVFMLDRTTEGDKDLKECDMADDVKAAREEEADDEANE